MPVADFTRLSNKIGNSHITPQLSLAVVPQAKNKEWDSNIHINLQIPSRSFLLYRNNCTIYKEKQNKCQCCL